MLKRKFSVLIMGAVFASGAGVASAHQAVPALADASTVQTSYVKRIAASDVYDGMSDYRGSGMGSGGSPFPEDNSED